MGLNDGALEFLGPSGRQVWIRGVRIRLDEVRAALLEDPSIAECVVLVREAETSGPTLVAYVVLAGQLSPERLQASLQAILPAEMLPCAYVPVSTLPLTAAGQVDERALAHVEVIDAELVQRWGEHLRWLRKSRRWRWWFRSTPRSSLRYTFQSCFRPGNRLPWVRSESQL